MILCFQECQKRHDKNEVSPLRCSHGAVWPGSRSVLGTVSHGPREGIFPGMACVRLNLKLKWD